MENNLSDFARYTSILWEDKGGDAQTVEVDAPASTALETKDAYDDKFFPLITNAYYATLLCFNLSMLSVIMPVSKPHKHYTVTYVYRASTQ